MAVISLCVTTLLILSTIADDEVDIDEFDPEPELQLKEDLPSDADLIIDVTHAVSDDDCKIKSQNGDTLVMHYTGTLYKDGTKFDSSLDRNQAFEFELGAGRVIQGWDKGLLSMCIGEKRTLTIASDLGYGDRGSGDIIAGGATLMFDTELLDIKRPKPDSVVLTFEEYEDLNTKQINLESDEFQVIAFIKKSSKRERLFDAIAKEMKDEGHISFYKIYDEQYKIEMRRNNPQLFGDEISVFYQGRIAASKKSKKAVFKFTSYDLRTWIEDYHMPLFINVANLHASIVTEMDNNIYSVLYRSAKIPQKGVLLIRIADNDDAIELQSELQDIVRQLRKDGFVTLLSSQNEAIVGFVDGVEMLLIQKEVDKIPLLPSGFEAPRGQATHIETLRRKYGRDSDETVREYRYQWFDEVNKENLAQFYKSVVVDQTAKRWIRSADISDEEETDYEVVSATNFDELVLDKSSDVLVLYCKIMSAYCSESRKEYKKLAKHMKRYYKNQAIKIVYMDGERNDLRDIRVVSLPTMILYPAGNNEINKGKLLSKQQQQTVDDIVDFIDEFATNLNKEEL